jgi:hypothetical protein
MENCGDSLHGQVGRVRREDDADWLMSCLGAWRCTDGAGNGRARRVITGVVRADGVELNARPPDCESSALPKS